MSVVWDQVQFVYAFVGQLVVNYVKDSYQHDPLRIFLELLLVFFALKYLLSPTKVEKPLTPAEQEQLVKDWSPTPVCSLFPSLPGDERLREEEAEAPLPLDLRSTNYVRHPAELTQELKKIVREYGVGTCGPPGFYGTLDLHVFLEHQLASFFDCETAVLYSQAFSAVSSTIPAFIKKDDIVVADAGCHYAIKVGVRISRGSVFYFKHNDLADLARVLEAIDQMIVDKKLTLPRKYIVVEALYQETGNVLDLRKIVDLKWKHKCRVILDESNSLGTISGEGGLARSQGVPSSDLDIIVGSLNASIGSCGGFACGSRHVSDHQRLGSAAYCFSASTPALLAKYAMLTLPRMNDGVERLGALTEAFLGYLLPLPREDWTLRSDKRSPIVCLQAPTHQAAVKTIEVLRRDYKIGVQLSDFLIKTNSNGGDRNNAGLEGSVKFDANQASLKRRHGSILKLNLHTGLTEAELCVIGEAVRKVICIASPSSPSS
jgi:serine palmitoyltransferase